ncbi:MAG: GntR family transcriptional regulator [Bacillota bacterium]|nr:GntR family transcriptional regulator [Bacillota bacterium]
MAVLDKESPIPLYHQLKEELRRRIETGEFTKSAAIPTEPELEQMYDVSRVTVRRAVQDLVHEGLLVKRKGKGTFVAAVKVSQKLNMISSWAETMAARGVPTETRDIQIKTVPAPPKVAAALEIPPEAPVVKIDRLRCTPDGPVTAMTNYLLPELVPGLCAEDVKGSLYQTLEKKYHLVLARAHERVEAKPAGTAEAAMLGVRRGAPLLHITRVTYGPDGRPLELVMAASRADRYAYEVELVGRPKNQ